MKAYDCFGKEIKRGDLCLVVGNGANSEEFIKEGMVTRGRKETVHCFSPYEMVIIKTIRWECDAPSLRKSTDCIGKEYGQYVLAKHLCRIGKFADLGEYLGGDEDEF